MKSYYKLIVIILILGASALIGYEYLKYGSLFKDNDYYRRAYVKAINLKQEEKYRSAYYTFAQIAPRYSAYDAVLFHQADCAAKLEDEQTTQKKLKLLIGKYPKSIIAAQSEYNLAKSYLRTSKYEMALERFNNIIKTYPKTDYAIGSYYYLGQIARRQDKQAAVEYWKKYIAFSPNGRFSYDCIDLILSSEAKLNEKEKYDLAIALYFAKRYEKAIEYLKQLPEEKKWYYLAMSYKGKNQQRTALKILKSGIKRYSNKVSYEKLANAMMTYSKLYPYSKVRAWDELARLTKGRSNAEDIALYNKAVLLSDNQAYPIYKRIYSVYPKGFFASEALWNMFWYEYSRRNYSKALDLGKMHIHLFPKTNAAPKALFWMGKLSEKRNKKNDAKKYYKKLIDVFPDDYYSFRATGRLAAINGKYDNGWKTDIEHSIDKSKFNLKLPYTYNQVKKEHGSTYAELLASYDYELLGYINGLGDEFIESWLKYKDGLKSKSIVIARNKIAKTFPRPDKEDLKWQFVYPIYFSELINKYAEQNHLDPYIVISLMREESYFNNMAVSSSNARGLMQLLPATAKDIASWKRLGRVNDLLLFNPETNIKLGTAYLKYAKDRLHNKTVFAVGAYNGGPAAVERWIKTQKYSDIDEFIEKIPYEQTRKYIKKVYRSYWNYNRIYEE